MYQPLADLLRPQTLDEVYGQEHILGKGAVLRRRVFPDAIQLGGVRLFQHFPVFGLYPGLMPPDIPVADNGIQRQPKCQQKQHSRQKYLPMSPPHVLPPRHGTAPEGFSGAVQNFFRLLGKL